MRLILLTFRASGPFFCVPNQISVIKARTSLWQAFVRLGVNYLALHNRDRRSFHSAPMPSEALALCFVWHLRTRALANEVPD